MIGLFLKEGNAFSFWYTTPTPKHCSYLRRSLTRRQAGFVYLQAITITLKNVTSRDSKISSTAPVNCLSYYKESNFHTEQRLYHVTEQAPISA